MTLCRERVIALPVSSEPTAAKLALRADMGRTVPSSVPVAKVSVTPGLASAPVPLATWDLPVSKVTERDQVTSPVGDTLQTPSR